METAHVLSDESRILAGILLLSLVTVETGGLYLLSIVRGAVEVTPFQEKFARAGHAHAGVLLVLSLVYFLYPDRTGYSTGVQWLAGLLLLVGIIAQSGGFFLHLARGQKNRSSVGTVVTRTGALLLAAALIILAIGLL
jgi:hypothetical protein